MRFGDYDSYYHATSTNGLDWNDYVSVLDAGEPGEFDFQIGSLDVVKVNGAYHMWYAARQNSSTGHTRFAYATSADGLNWEKHGLVGGFEVLDSLYSGDTTAPSILLDGAQLRMWCHVDNSRSVYHASIPLVDCNTNGLFDACDLDCGGYADGCHAPGCGLSANYNTNFVPDECDPDFDGDGQIDDCDPDIDDDGALNWPDQPDDPVDTCDYTPLGAANIILDPQSSLYGTIRRDLDGDCDCDLHDFAVFVTEELGGGLTGPND